MTMNCAFCFTTSVLIDILPIISRDSRFSDRTIIFFWRIQETKGFSSFFRMYFMMNIMRSHDSLHIAAACVNFHLYPAMNNNIMKNEVEEAIERNARANPG